MPDFQRPTPHQLLLDMKTHCLEKGKRFDENEMIDYVNEEFESNGWKHPDIPLQHVASPETFPEDPRRAELIRKDDAVAKAEIEKIKAESRERESEREAAERAQGSELRRALEENRQLAARLAALEGRSPESVGTDPSAAAVNAPIVPDGLPSESWTMKELEEFANANSITLPASGKMLNTVGKKSVSDMIHNIMRERGDARFVEA